jgi:hypothetical protein
MNHPLRCRCGTLQGYVLPRTASMRAVCYCKDCQAYARFLGTPGIVDEDGGTEVVASLPKHLHFTGGLEVLACMSLSERGILRWYANCCKTPVGNTPRNPKLPYVGVIHSCLEASSPTLESSFGPLHMAVNTNSARTKVQSTPIASTVGMLTLMMSVLGSRLTGAHKINPFFLSDSGIPIRQPRVLSNAERARVYRSEG